MIYFSISLWYTGCIAEISQVGPQGKSINQF